MKNKNYLLIFGALVLIGMIVFVSAGWFSGDATRAKASINANSCNADGICEMKVAMVSGEVNTPKIDVNEVNVNVMANERNILSARDGLVVTGTNVDADNPDKFIVHSPAIFNSPTNFNSVVYFTNLKGTGNAYACLNQDGILYRSIKPCV